MPLRGTPSHPRHGGHREPVQEIVGKPPRILEAQRFYVSSIHVACGNERLALDVKASRRIRIGGDRPLSAAAWASGAGLCVVKRAASLTGDIEALAASPWTPFVASAESLGQLPY